MGPAARAAKLALGHADARRKGRADVAEEDERMRLGKAWRSDAAGGQATGNARTRCAQRGEQAAALQGAGALEQLAHVLPADIERTSFTVIEEGLAQRGVALDATVAPVVKRVVHTTADFDFARTLAFSAHAVDAGVNALRSGCTVVTDTRMALAGVNKRALARLGSSALTFIDDEEVAREAVDRKLTRSAVSMEHAARLSGPLVFAIGNAPTALMRLCELAEAGALSHAALVIGVPVGFVNVEEAKERALSLGMERIVARGRKGGSPVAAAIVNALIYLAGDAAERGAAVFEATAYGRSNDPDSN